MPNLRKQVYQMGRVASKRRRPIARPCASVPAKWPLRRT